MSGFLASFRVLARARMVFASLLVGVTALLGCLVVTLWYPRPSPSGTRSLYISVMTRTNELLYVEGESTPFTGVVIEAYRNGGPKSKTAIVDGRPHGVSEGFHLNGALQIRENYESGVLQGERTKYWDNGLKKSQGTVVDGVWEGAFKKWHDNGVLAQSLTLRGGEIVGVARTYDENGALLVEKTAPLGDGSGELRNKGAGAASARVAQAQ